jgi:hypothetical protein
MTKRQRTPPRGPDSVRAKGLRRQAFPALRAFLRGYLHQDYAAVHGSMRAAADAFRADASADERDQLVRELESLTKIVTATKAGALRGFISEEMGSGWLPASREEILELLDALRG